MDLNNGIPYELTAVDLQKCMPAADPKNVVLFAPKLQSAMAEYEIDTTRRAAAFLAQIAHETEELTHLVENLNYTAKRLLQIFPKYFNVDTADQYARQPEKIANRVYANRMGNGPEESGDGWKYRGRGCFMYTGLENYELASRELKYDFVKNPDDLTKPGPASFSAALYWHNRRLNRKADIDAMTSISKAINGGTIGLEDRLQHWARCAKVLKVEI